jgi:ribonuclease P protein component
LASEGRPDARRRRLSRSGDFDRVYREGSSRGNRFLVVHSFDRDDAAGAGTRLGISVGRKIGKAVQRNKVKRVVRQAFWDLAGDVPPARDYVIVARPGIEGLLDREGPDAIRSSLAELIGEGAGADQGEQPAEEERAGEERLS